jgi:hypothetical protein
VDRLGRGHGLPAARRGRTGIVLAGVPDPADSREVSTRFWRGRLEADQRRTRGGNSQPRRRAVAQKQPPWSSVEFQGGSLERFRRSPTFAPKHYHGPGGLNGRVRNGNGCDPAGMVAGKPAGGLSGRAGRDSAVVGHRHMVFTPHQKSWHVRKNQNPPFVIWYLSSGIRHLPSAICHLPAVIRIESVRPPDRPGWRSCHGTTAQRADRGGQAAWLLGPVG